MQNKLGILKRILKAFSRLLEAHKKNLTNPRKAVLFASYRKAGHSYHTEYTLASLSHLFYVVCMESQLSCRSGHTSALCGWRAENATVERRLTRAPPYIPNTQYKITY
ncbi:hypothetical protein EVAR_66046_1 [Eumeta japonica]|uniref:Uncharacterized protein n=1 Tax=Eumeta variegata TaxID=151549 RepID=A0A4C2A175_EUMVA|nr:hypothetical protein EVAR_66046_1 [Eumeta japonica]